MTTRSGTSNCSAILVISGFFFLDRRIALRLTFFRGDFRTGEGRGRFEIRVIGGIFLWAGPTLLRFAASLRFNGGFFGRWTFDFAGLVLALTRFLAGRFLALFLLALVFFFFDLTAGAFFFLTFARLRAILIAFR
jgi:hypothetical protein